MRSGKPLLGLLYVLLSVVQSTAGPALVTPQCNTGDTTSAALAAHKGESRLFFEDDGAYPTKVYLANCATRQAVVFKNRGRSRRADATQSAEMIMLDALRGDGALNLNRVKRQITALDIWAKRVSLPSNHCACGLQFDANSQGLNAALSD